MEQRPPEIREYVQQIRALDDRELREFERSIRSENVLEAANPRLFAFHLQWTMREIEREWKRRNGD